MISKLKNLAIGTVATAGLVFGQAAVAGLLTVQLGAFVCADNAACDLNPAANTVQVSAGVNGVPLIPGYSLASATAFSNNPGGPSFSLLDLSWQVASINTVGGPLTILASQTDWTFPPGGALTGLQEVCGGDALNASVTCQEWANLANTLNGLGPITPGPQGPFTAPFSSTLSNNYVSITPYSLTDRLIFNLGANGTSTGDLRTIDRVPEPATLLLVGAALAGLGFSRRRKAS